MIDDRDDSDVPTYVRILVYAALLGCLGMLLYVLWGARP